MIIYPAIDIYEGQGVRLKKGKFNDVKVYGTPVELAQGFEKEGSDFLHIVDLNGARQDKNNNLNAIQAILNKTKMKVQLGGGIRDEKYAKALLAMGIEKIILGTAAIKNLDLIEALVAEYGDRIIVGIDAKEGKVAIEGWEEVSTMAALDLIKKLEKMGVKYVVYTDIAKDGMLAGPNFEIYEKLIQSCSLNIIASGGITDKDDLQKLEAIGVYGAIVGKALYESRINLKEVLSAD